MLAYCLLLLLLTTDLTTHCHLTLTTPLLIQRQLQLPLSDPDVNSFGITFALQYYYIVAEAVLCGVDKLIFIGVFGFT